jgi:hypothetical protein
MKIKNRKYSIKKQFYLNDEINNKLISDLKLAKKGMGEYLRGLIIDDKENRKLLIAKSEKDDLIRDYLDEIRRQGNNLNQIAYNLNSQEAFKKYNHSDLEEIRNIYREIFKKVKKIL